MKKHHKQMTVGEMLTALRPSSPQDSVRYDFGGLYLVEPYSYRGYYEDLAFGFADEGYTGHEKIIETVQALRENLEGVCGQEFTGYKGGTYLMSKDTPLWVANKDHATDTAIVGVTAYYTLLIIKTKYIA